MVDGPGISIRSAGITVPMSTPYGEPSLGRFAAVWVGGHRVLEQVSDRPRNEMAEGHLAGIPRVRSIEHCEEVTMGEDDAALIDEYVVVDEPNLDPPIGRRLRSACVNPMSWLPRR